MYLGRGKRKILADYKSNDIYEFYRSKYGEKALSKEVFWSVWERFIDIRMQMVIFENLEFYLPHRLGSIMIKLGKDANRINKNGNYQFITDWGATKKKWAELYPGLSAEELKQIKDKPLIPVFNKTTDGRRVYWRWDKVTCNYKNHSVYRIEVLRKWKRKLSEKVKKTKKNDYYE